jgi:hypothetical protein
MLVDLMKGTIQDSFPQISPASRYWFWAAVIVQILLVFLSKSLLDRVTFFIITIWAFNIFRGNKEYLGTLINIIIVSSFIIIPFIKNK